MMGRRTAGVLVVGLAVSGVVAFVPAVEAGAALECSVTFRDDLTEAWDFTISDDGSRIAFTSFDDLTGGNDDGTPELFLLDLDGPTLTQVTDSPTHDDAPGNPAISGDGSRIVFQSRGNVIGPNVPFNDEIYLYDVATGITTALTDTAPPWRNVGAAISTDGDVVAYTIGVGVDRSPWCVGTSTNPPRRWSAT